MPLKSGTSATWDSFYHHHVPLLKALLLRNDTSEPISSEGKSNGSHGSKGGEGHAGVAAGAMASSTCGTSIRTGAPRFCMVTDLGHLTRVPGKHVDSPRQNEKKVGTVGLHTYY
jgi:hypothetical protein